MIVKNDEWDDESFQMQINLNFERQQQTKIRNIIKKTNHYYFQYYAHSRSMKNIVVEIVCTSTREENTQSKKVQV